MKVDVQAERDQIAALQAFRKDRNQAQVEAALTALRAAAVGGDNIMPSSIDGGDPDGYIALKMDEVTRFRMSTHPVEFDMYYSI